MAQYGFAVFAIAFLGIAWWLTRLMSSVGRNDERSDDRGRRAA